MMTNQSNYDEEYSYSKIMGGRNNTICNRFSMIMFSKEVYITEDEPFTIYICNYKIPFKSRVGFALFSDLIYETVLLYYSAWCLELRR